MKDGVVIVNTARGAVMDEAALVRALDSGKVLSCGLDVYEDEPEVHPGLMANPNVMLVPHMGTWTVEVRIHLLSTLVLCSSGRERMTLMWRLDTNGHGEMEHQQRPQRARDGEAEESGGRAG